MRNICYTLFIGKSNTFSNFSFEKRSSWAFETWFEHTTAKANLSLKVQKGISPLCVYQQLFAQTLTRFSVFRDIYSGRQASRFNRNTVLVSPKIAKENSTQVRPSAIIKTSYEHINFLVKKYNK